MAGSAVWIEPSRPFRLTITKQRLYILLALVVLRLIMDYSYATYLSPENELDGHYDNFLNYQKLWESWLLMLGCSLFLPEYTRKPSDFVLYVFFLFPVMAMLSLYAFLDGDRLYAYLSAAAFVIVATVRNINLRFPVLQLKGGERWAIPVCFAVVLITALLYYLVLGFSYFQLDLMDVYTVRLDITARIAQAPVLGYLGSWTWSFVMGALFAWAIVRKRWLMLPLLLAIQVYFFGMTSAKTALAFPILFFVPYFLARSKVPLAWLFVAVIFIVAVGIAEELATETYFWNHIIVRRVMWEPARNNWFYHDLFARIGHVYMSDSVLKSLLPYPFKIDPQHLIGLDIYGRGEMNSDTGFLGTSYMHFGPAGMVIFSSIVGLLLRMADVLTVKRMPVWIGVAIIAAPFYAVFNDSDLTTSLATHGLAPALVLLFVYGYFPRERLRALERAVRGAGAPEPSQAG